MRRGSSGLSLVVGVDKPAGMSSHDVVDRCRRIFGERRVGHAGTLDPAASGVLPVLVGPATRLDAYLSGHDKRYLARIVFGVGTDTDDAEGAVVSRAPVPARLRDAQQARAYLDSIVGEHMQLPPVYSAIKVGGRKACDEARAGSLIDLSARKVAVYEARLIRVLDEDPADDAPLSSDYAAWDVDLRVSKGTYIRAIARDAGRDLGCPAHLGALERTAVGRLSLDDCVGLAALSQVKEAAALDPVALLGLRIVFADGALERRVAAGAAFPAGEAALFESRSAADGTACPCTSGVYRSCEGARDGEVVSVVAGNRLVALYENDGAAGLFKARCVFSTGVCRGCAV